MLGWSRPREPIAKPMLRTVLAVLVLSVASAAQSIDPIGRVHPAAQPLAAIARLTVGALDRPAISNEDEQRRAAGLPARLAMPFVVDATPATHGSWEQLDATWSLWRLVVVAPDAYHVNLAFRSFDLPDTARVMFYASDYSHVLRPFDAGDELPGGELWTPVVMTASIVVELYVPTAQRGAVTLRLAQVNSGYRFFGSGHDALPIDGSGTCNLDVACPAASAWAEEIPAVAMILIGGTNQCSGAMLNNTAQDGRAYFLTANHCVATAGSAASVVFYWNYDEPTCGGAGAPTSMFTLGATLRSTWLSTDFTLLECSSVPTPAWGVTYLGWSRTNTASTNATGIHHPSGDAKKISFENQATQLARPAATT
jgi:lysyl endopeptidase